MKLSKVIREVYLVGYFPIGFLRRRPNGSLVPLAVPWVLKYDSGSRTKLLAIKEEINVDELIEKPSAYRTKIRGRMISPDPICEILGGMHLCKLYVLLDYRTYDKLARYEGSPLYKANQYGSVSYVKYDIRPIEAKIGQNRVSKNFALTLWIHEELVKDLRDDRRIYLGRLPKEEDIEFGENGKLIGRVPAMVIEDPKRAEEIMRKTIEFLEDRPDYFEEFPTVFFSALYTTMNSVLISVISREESLNFGSLLQKVESSELKSARYDFPEKGLVDEIIKKGIAFFRCPEKESKVLIKIDERHVFKKVINVVKKPKKLSGRGLVILLCPHDAYPLISLKDAKIPETRKKLLMISVGATKEENVLFCERCLNAFRSDNNYVHVIELDKESLELLKQGKLCMLHPIIYGSYGKGDLENIILAKALKYVLGDSAKVAHSVVIQPDYVERGGFEFERRRPFEVDVAAYYKGKLVLIEVKRKVVLSPHEAATYFLKFFLNLDAILAWSAREMSSEEPWEVHVIFYDSYPRFSFDGSYKTEIESVSRVIEEFSKSFSKGVRVYFKYITINELFKRLLRSPPEDLPEDVDVFSYLAAKEIMNALEQ